MIPSLNIIGAGAVGKTLGRLFVDSKVATIGSIVNATRHSAEQAVSFIGAGNAVERIEQALPADITLITTPDDHIQPCCEQLSNSDHLKPKSLIVHCSGALSSEILLSAKAKDCYIASVHPLLSFADPTISIKQYDGTYCGMEGDDVALEPLTQLFTAIGSKVFTLSTEQKSLYHCACVFACNYAVTLIHMAQNCFTQSGINKDMAKNISLSLMQTALDNIKQNPSLQQSLTGPIQRGDAKTITEHLAALDHETLLQQSYQLLGKMTLSLTSLTDIKMNSLSDMLTPKENKS